MVSTKSIGWRNKSLNRQSWIRRRAGGEGVLSPVRWLELKDTSEWRERLPLSFGRKSAHARGRSGVVLVVCHLADRHGLRPR